MPGLETPRPVHQPVLLLRNVRYPTYQLYATAGCGKASPDTVLKIAVLETMNWLRQRFRAFDLPAELNWPDASQYETVDSKDFKTFLLNEGYKVEVVWLPADKIWALQLTEPDLGPQPGAEHQTRQPVPGRLYETNIAYRVVGDQVVCGFCTVVAEPDTTTESSEVFRLAVIKKLARNPLVGLKQGWPLSDEPHALDTINAIRRLQTWLTDPERMLPAVIAVECAPQATTLDNLPSFQELVSQSAQPKPPSFANPLPMYTRPNEAGGYSINMTELARMKMGYAMFFILPLAQIDAFQKITKISATPGKVIISEPLAFKGLTPPADDADATWLQNQLDQLISEYPKRKPMRFGAAVFLAEARIKYQELLMTYSQSKEDFLLQAQKADEAKRQRYKEELETKQDTIRQRDEKIRRLNEQISILESTVHEHRNELADLERQHQKAIENKDMEITHLQSLLCRPKHPIAVKDWVEKCFQGRLIFHARASELMSTVNPSEVDLTLLCDALEFLATEYRDELLGLINADERNACCSRKYCRPFDVAPVNDKTIEHYSNDYKIKYYVGRNGKPAESQLNLHLKVGNTSENLLRIYFLYDKDRKLVVVGSLPWHLKTEGYR